MRTLPHNGHPIQDLVPAGEVEQGAAWVVDRLVPSWMVRQWAANNLCNGIVEGPREAQAALVDNFQDFFIAARFRQVGMWLDFAFAKTRRLRQMAKIYRSQHGGSSI